MATTCAGPARRWGTPWPPRRPPPAGTDRFGELTLSRPADGPVGDAPVSSDPVLHPLPGLRLPGPLAR
jgi:hypothetical protein